MVTWDIYDERAPIQQLDAHNDKITSVEISPLGKNIASASTDCTISMWGKVPKLK